MNLTLYTLCPRRFLAELVCRMEQRKRPVCCRTWGKVFACPFCDQSVVFLTVHWPDALASLELEYDFPALCFVLRSACCLLITCMMGELLILTCVRCRPRKDLLAVKKAAIGEWPSVLRPCVSF